ncbi:MAG: DUF559 domain-containing protein [Actinomycetota bacterium]|nr:DUF559 domain-containing protein [Actinomycetota bacterium]
MGQTGTTPSTHERLLAIASRQDGVVGRAQLVAAGFPATQVDQARKSRRLLPVFRGVYAVGTEIETVDSLWRAATIAGGGDAVLMGRSAAEAWGMIGHRRHGLPRTVEIARPVEPRTLRSCSRGIPNTKLDIRTRTLFASEITRLRGIPVTTPACAFIELARRTRADELRRLFIEACRLGLIRKDDLAYCLSRSRSRPGAGRVREMVGLWVPGIERTRSLLEALFLLGWAQRDSRLPEVNVLVGRFEVDFFWRKERVVVETDGKAYHDHEIARRRDAKKDAWLRSQGCTVIRLGYREVDQEMEASCAAVKAELDRQPHRAN